MSDLDFSELLFAISLQAMYQMACVMPGDFEPDRSDMMRPVQQVGNGWCFQPPPPRPKCVIDPDRMRSEKTSRGTEESVVECSVCGQTLRLGVSPAWAREHRFFKNPVMLPDCFGPPSHPPRSEH